VIELPHSPSSVGNEITDDGREMKDIQLSRMVDMENPYRVIDEVRAVVKMMYPEFDFATLNHIFSDIIRLFQGDYPGYEACTTNYHDLNHTTDTLLAMARLMHGAVVKGEHFTEDHLQRGLVAALMHDTGYIKRSDEVMREKIPSPLMDIKRSISFLQAYCSDNGLPKEAFHHLPVILTCTDLNAKISTLTFPNPQVELLGKMLGTADLLGQMADRTYLEKLLFLFYEFRESGIMGYASELDLLKKTREFFAMSKKRLADELDGINGYMRWHFKARWNLDRDLYTEALETQITYLTHILTHHEKDYRKHLRRGGVVKKLRERKR
jgi:hypothetical protein